MAAFALRVYEGGNVKAVARALLFASACAVFGCAHVPVYARQKLAHPTMRLEEQAGPAEAHVYAVHEGAAGGGAEAASGCGCN